MHPDRRTREALPRVYVVLLNWNGWRDTVACLESLLRIDYENVRILICDNGSTDNSVEKFRLWSAGELPMDFVGSSLGAAKAGRSGHKQRLLELTREQTESLDQSGNVGDLVLIQTGANLGFAGGCNVGLRYAIACGDADYVWLLNNDTVVAPTALSELLKVASAEPVAGITGSTLVFFDRPNTVQALGGGKLNLWRGMTRHIGEGESFGVGRLTNPIRDETQMSYVVGASMLVSRAFIREVGLMQEDYFLYFEELDWAERARRAQPPFTLAYAPGSVVYHRVGASAGTAERSLSSIGYFNRSRLKFMSRFYPGQLPLVRATLCWESMKAMLKGRFSEAALVARIALSRSVT